MPVVSQKLGALTGFEASTNLNNLANDAAKPLGSIDNTSLKYPSAFVSLSFATSSDLAYNGAIEVYFLACVDTTNSQWSDDIDPDSTSDVSASMLNIKPISPPLIANNDVSGESIVWICNDLAKEVGDLPAKWTIVVHNKTGQALSGSGNKAIFQLKSYQV